MSRDTQTTQAQMAAAISPTQEPLNPYLKPKSNPSSTSEAAKSRYLAAEKRREIIHQETLQNQQEYLQDNASYKEARG